METSLEGRVQDFLLKMDTHAHVSTDVCVIIITFALPSLDHGEPPTRWFLCKISRNSSLPSGQPCVLNVFIISSRVSMILSTLSDADLFSTGLFIKYCVDKWLLPLTIRFHSFGFWHSNLRAAAGASAKIDPAQRPMFIHILLSSNSYWLMLPN